MLTPVLAARFGYGILLAGVLVSLVAAMLPHYGAGYRLDFGIMLTGMLPYLLYLLPAALWRAWPSVIAGLGVLAVHVAVVVHVRWRGGAMADVALLYLVPLLLSAALLPLVLVALRQRWHG